jgi:DNA-binding SARP family transcriptional activator/TolB-like protein
MTGPVRPARLRFRAIGTTELINETGVPVTAVLAQPRSLALFAYLCLARPTGFRRREELLAMFWPESDEARARSALSQALHRLRTGLGKDVIVTRGADEVAVDLARVECDVLELDQAIEEGGGELLPGLSLTDAPEFERWLETERASLRQRLVGATWRNVDQALKEGRRADALRGALRAAELVPFDEAATRRYLALLADEGNLSAAVQHYDRFKERLWKDLELEPSAETVELVAKLRVRKPSAPSLAATFTPPTTPPVAAQRHRRYLRWDVAVATLGIIGLATAGILGAFSTTPTPSTERVLVLPFVIRGDSSVQFLAEGMVDLLATRLDGLAGMNAVDPSAALAIPDLPRGSETKATDAAAHAVRLDAASVVIGRIVQTGDQLELSATVANEKGEVEGKAVARSRGIAGIPAAVDELARQILSIRLRQPADRLGRLAAVTTDSLSALRAYLTGEQDLRVGRHAQAVESFRQAVAIDSGFSLAWFRLAVAVEWVETNSEERRMALERSIQTSSRLTERDSLLVRGYQAYAFGSAEQAETIYRQLVSVYPDDVEAWYGLSEVLWHVGPLLGRDILQSEPGFNRVLQLHPGHVEARLHLSRLLALRGDVAALDRMIESTLPLLQSNTSQQFRLHLLRALAVNDSSALDTLQREVAALPPRQVLSMASSMASTTGNLAGVERMLTRLTGGTQAAQWRAHSRMTLVFLVLAQEGWPSARLQLDTLHQEDPALALMLRSWLSAQPWLVIPAAERDSVRQQLAAWNPAEISATTRAIYPYYASFGTALRLFDLAALSSLIGDSIAARDYIAQLRALPPLDSPHPREWELAANATALDALVRGDAAGALATLSRLRPGAGFRSFPQSFVFDHSLERWIRAEALRASGRWEEALEWYSSFNPYLSVMAIPVQRPAKARIGEIEGGRKGR